MRAPLAQLAFRAAIPAVGGFLQRDISVSGLSGQQKELRSQTFPLCKALGQGTCRMLTALQFGITMLQRTIRRG